MAFNSSTKVEVQLNSRTKEVVREIERIGLKYRFEPNFQLDRLDPKRRIQVRDANHIAPAESVKQYAASMRQGAEFPAGIVTGDEKPLIVDFNSRLEAARKIGLPTFPVIELEAKFDTADDKTKALIMVLASTLNQKNGVRHSTAEAKRNVPHYLTIGMTTDQIAATLGLSVSLVNMIKREIAGRESLATARFTGDLDNRQVSAFGSKEVAAVREKARYALADLAVDAGLSKREIEEIARDYHAAPSDSEGMDLIDARREGMQKRILDHRIAKTGTKPSNAAKVRRALGQIIAYGGAEATAVEADTVLAPGYLQTLLDAISILKGIAKHQESAGTTLPAREAAE